MIEKEKIELLKDTFIINVDIPVVVDDNLITLLAQIFDEIAKIVILIFDNKKKYLSLRQNINERELRIISECINDEKYINHLNTLNLSKIQPIFK